MNIVSFNKKKKFKSKLFGICSALFVSSLLRRVLLFNLNSLVKIFFYFFFTGNSFAMLLYEGEKGLIQSDTFLLIICTIFEQTSTFSKICILAQLINNV